MGKKNFWKILLGNIWVGNIRGFMNYEKYIDVVFEEFIIWIYFLYNINKKNLYIDKIKYRYIICIKFKLRYRYILEIW